MRNRLSEFGGMMMMCVRIKLTWFVRAVGRGWVLLSPDPKPSFHGFPSAFPVLVCPASVVRCRWWICTCCRLVRRTGRRRPVGFRCGTRFVSSLSFFLGQPEPWKGSLLPPFRSVGFPVRPSLLHVLLLFAPVLVRNVRVADRVQQVDLPVLIHKRDGM